MSARPFDGHPAPYAEALLRGAFRARVIGVHDGDTLTVIADQGFDSVRVLDIRVAGINCAEIRGGTATSRAAGATATTRTAALCLPNGPDLPGAWAMIVTHKQPDGDDRQSFTRYVADVFLCTGHTETNLATVLLAEGLAVRVSKP